MLYQDVQNPLMGILGFDLNLNDHPEREYTQVSGNV